MSSFSQKLLNQILPGSVHLKQTQTLYQTLSRLPQDGVGSHLRQVRWDRLNRHDTYWMITRVKLKNDGRHGKAWGMFVYKGKPISQRDELIRGGLKWRWREMTSSELADRTPVTPAPTTQAT
ncbi:uncharacterized protein EI90DRAFT_2908107 [Cantharellus anzutake]|uniref:uncharacterized protein n=1 Tax=Cantharellus anzutake TaxID=1750568 RepID=UPI001906AF85|nr:uncharacterized protein EI90DRAFT_2908107 [Cantharellus anzutake]KAF8339159.1 hypothetical protein EI90DRAFT_2908107 [Cantharellus anzutake]